MVGGGEHKVVLEKSGCRAYCVWIVGEISFPSGRDTYNRDKSLVPLKVQVKYDSRLI